MIKYRDSDHTYWDGDAQIPGVTGLIGIAHKLDHIPKGRLQHKADIGRAVHLATELDDDGDLDESSIDPAIEGYLEAWRLFRREVPGEIIAREQVVYHPIYGYAGQLDRVIDPGKNKDQYVVDIKTVAGVLSPYTGLQLSAYREAYCYGKDLRMAPSRAVQLRADGTYRLVKFAHHSDDFSAFLKLLFFHRWQVANGVEK